VFLSVTLDIPIDDQANPMGERKCPCEISALLGLRFHAAFLFRLTTAATIIDFRVYLRKFFMVFIFLRIFVFHRRHLDWVLQVIPEVRLPLRMRGIPESRRD